MQMRTCAPTSAAHSSYLMASFNPLPFFYTDIRHVPITRLIAITMAYCNSISCISIIAGQCYHSISSCKNRGTGWGGDIQPIMKLVNAAKGRFKVAKPGGRQTIRRAEGGGRNQDGLLILNGGMQFVKALLQLHA